MNRPQRLRAILDLLAERGSIEIDDIVSKLGCSQATCRRDLDALAEQQLLTRTHGGAVVFSSVAYGLPLRYKNQQQTDAKAAIAQVASAMVPRGSVVGLSGGTTSTMLADVLMSRADIQEPASDPGLTVVTNAVNIAMALAARPQIKTVTTGGALQPRSYELVGAFAETMLHGINLDFAFIGATGMTARGASANDEAEAVVNRTMASRAREAVLIIDAKKIGQQAFATIGDASLFQSIITDSAITKAQLRELESYGYRVRLAE